MAIEAVELNRKARRTLCLLLFLAVCASTARTQDTLSFGKTVTEQIGGGKTRSFKFSLTQGQFTEIHIEQRGAILRATLFDPQGREVIEMDYPGGGYGPIYLSTIATASGDYKLDVRSVNSWANPASYEITLTTPRNATPADQTLNAAQLSFSQARKNFRSGKANEAIEAYENSLKDWQSLGDDHWQAVTQYALSEAYRNRDRHKAVERLNETLRLLNLKMAPNDWRLKASALNDLGAIYSSSGETEKAFTTLNAALELYTANGDRRGQASALGNLGFIYFSTGDLSAARELFDKAQAHRRAENDKPGAANLVNNIAAISDRLGDTEQALAYATQALRDWDEIGELRPADKPRVAAVLNNIATANDKLGRWDQAFEFYDKSLEKYDEHDPDRAGPLDNKGELYAALGNPIKARESYDRALEILAAAKKPDLDLKAGILVHIGQLFLTGDDPVMALKYFEEARDLPPKDPRLADVYTNLGVAFTLNGNLEEAMKAYAQALEIQTRLKNQRGQALALQKRGEARMRVGKTSEALEDFNRALAFWKAVKDRRGEAATLNDIALAERDRGNFDAALARSAEAIQIVESLRTGISNRQLRTSYFAAQENYYELDIDLKMQLSRKEKRDEHLAAALESAERSRARVLLDTLNEAGLSRGDFNPAANPRLAKLIEERTSLLNRLAAKSQARTNALSGAANAKQIAIFDREIGQLNDSYEALETKIRAHDPRFANLTKPQPATLREIQEQLGIDTILVEYFLGETRSYVWIVTRDSIDGVELPARTEIEALAKRVYDALSARGKDEPKEDGAQKMKRVTKSEKDFSDASALLSKMVLEPIASRLGEKRLAIVADGTLQTLPFGVLPVPQSARATTVLSKPSQANTAISARPLLENNEIVSLPSASILVLQRSELAKRKPAPLAVAVLADPVFDDKDSRVKASSSNNRQGSTPPPSSSQTRALSDIGAGEPGRIRRLMYSLEEAQAILKLADPKQTFKAVDFEASRSTAMSSKLSNYRIIHLATHGVMNLTHPELSGILFSMVDESGRPTNGYLGLNEIYNLNLPADLIVLSACETGVGKQVKGEGLIALTRGFMHAGAERVIASLWNVDDKATAELMKEFYKQIFVNKLKPAAALRQAQVKLREQPPWRNPHFWAGFVLQGEWR